MPGGKGGSDGPGLIRQVNFNTPAFNGIVFDESGVLKTNIRRNQTQGLNAIESRFPRFLRDFDTIRNDVRPGFSEFRRQGIESLRNAARAGIGDLRESLSRRRVAGSSFANDTLSRARAEFGKQEAEFAAATTLQELDAFSRVLASEENFIRNELARDLAESGFAANLTTSFGGIISKNLQFLREEAANDAAGFGSVIGSIVGGAAGSFFGPLGTAAGSALGGALFGGAGGGAGSTSSIPVV